MCSCYTVYSDNLKYASRFISLMCEKEPELKIAQLLALEFYRMRRQ